MAQSNHRPKEEHLQIAMFALGPLDQSGEVRNDGFLGFVEVLRRSHISTWNILADGRFAAQSEFDIE